MTIRCPRRPCYTLSRACQKTLCLRSCFRVDRKFLRLIDYYLNSLTDPSQYPAARCSMGDNIYLYHRTSSAAVESMNAANKELRQRTAVDLVNATILLFCLECNRFNKMKELVWQSDSDFTPRGEMEYRETFEGINYRDFTMITEEKDDRYEVVVSRRARPNKMFYVVIPKEPVNGSYFGRCSCGVDKRDAVPCDHMAAIVVSSRIPMLTRINIMPYWWTRATWKLQFPLEQKPVCNVNLEQIRMSKNRNGFIRYCPSWSAPNKAG